MQTHDIKSKGFEILPSLYSVCVFKSYVVKFLYAKYSGSALMQTRGYVENPSTERKKKPHHCNNFQQEDECILLLSTREQN